MLVAVIDVPCGAGLAAVGTAEVQQRLPGPSNPSGLLGYIGTMATDPVFRGQGMATAVLGLLLDELRARDVDRIELHATPVAEALYRPGGLRRSSRRGRATPSRRLTLPTPRSGW